MPASRSLHCVRRDALVLRAKANRAPNFSLSSHRLFTTLLHQLRSRPWCPSVRGEASVLLPPCHVFRADDPALGGLAPLLCGRVSSELLDAVGMRGQPSAADAAVLVDEWAALPAFATSVRHMRALYRLLCGTERPTLLSGPK